MCIQQTGTTSSTWILLRFKSPPKAFYKYSSSDRYFPGAAYLFQGASQFFQLFFLTLSLDLVKVVV